MHSGKVCCPIPYVKKKDLKASINEQMVFTHPWIEDLHLTLTAIRKIKNIMMNLTGDTLEVPRATLLFWAKIKTMITPPPK